MVIEHCGDTSTTASPYTSSAQTTIEYISIVSLNTEGRWRTNIPRRLRHADRRSTSPVRRRQVAAIVPGWIRFRTHRRHSSRLLLHLADAVRQHGLHFHLANNGALRLDLFVGHRGAPAGSPENVADGDVVGAEQGARVRQGLLSFTGAGGAPAASSAGRADPVVPGLGIVDRVVVELRQAPLAELLPALAHVGARTFRELVRAERQLVDRPGVLALVARRPTLHGRHRWWHPIRPRQQRQLRRLVGNADRRDGGQTRFQRWRRQLDRFDERVRRFSVQQGRGDGRWRLVATFGPASELERGHRPVRVRDHRLHIGNNRQAVGQQDAIRQVVDGVAVGDVHGGLARALHLVGVLEDAGLHVAFADNGEHFVPGGGLHRRPQRTNLQERPLVGTPRATHTRSTDAQKCRPTGLRGAADSTTHTHTTEWAQRDAHGHTNVCPACSHALFSGLPLTRVRAVL